MSDAPETIVSDAEIEKHHFGSWGSMTPREVVNEGVLKYAHGFSSGYTQLQILLSHKLLKKPKPGSYRADLSQKGKAYARSLYKPRPDLCANAQSRVDQESPDLLDDPRVKALVEAAKEVGRISDRDHVAWRRLSAALAAMKGGQA